MLNEKSFEIFYEVYKNGKLLFREKSKSFLKNFALLLYGIATYTNPSGMKDINGSTFTLRITAETVQAPRILAIGTSDTPISTEDYTLTNYTEITTIQNEEEYTSYAVINVIGSRGTLTTETWKEVGLVSTLYDTGGVARKTLLARDIFPQPVVLEPGDFIIVAYRIVIAV